MQVRNVTGIVLIAAVLTAGGCGGPPPAEWIDVASTPRVPAATSAAPIRPVEVTNACDVLPAKSVIDIMGGSSATKLKVRNDGVDDLGEGALRYTCAYGRDGTEPFALSVTTRPDPDGTVVESIDAIAAAGDGEAKRVKGLGEGIDGVTFVKGPFRMVAVAVPYETDLRIAVFVAPKAVPRVKLVEMAEHLVTRL